MREPMPPTRHLRVFETLNEAWDLTKGCKWAIIGPMLSILGAGIILGLILGIGIALTKASGKIPAPTGMEQLNSIAQFILIAGMLILGIYSIGLICGLLKISIERARGNPVSASMGFKYFSRLIPVLLTVIVVLILTELPQIIMLIKELFSGVKITNIHQILPVEIIQIIYGLIVGAFLYLSLLLAVDNTNSPFTVVKRSFKATRHHWLTIIGIELMVFLIIFVAYIPMQLGIFLQNQIVHIIGGIFLSVALIWILPFVFLVRGVVYHKLID